MTTELTISSTLYRTTLSTDDQNGWKVLSISKDTGDVHASARGDSVFAAVCAAEWQGLPAYIGEGLLDMWRHAGMWPAPRAAERVYLNGSLDPSRVLLPIR